MFSLQINQFQEKFVKSFLFVEGRSSKWFHENFANRNFILSPFLNNFNVRSSMINIVFDVTNFVTFSAEKNWGFFTCYCLYNQLQFNEWESVSRNFPNSQQWKTFLFKMGLSWSYFKNTLNKIHFVSNSLKKHITNNNTYGLTDNTHSILRVRYIGDVSTIPIDGVGHFLHSAIG